MSTDSSDDRFDSGGTEPRRGQGFQSPLALPAFILVACVVLLVVSSLAAAGYMRPSWAVPLLAIAVLVGLAAIKLLFAERRWIRTHGGPAESHRQDAIPDGQ